MFPSAKWIENSLKLANLRKNSIKINWWLRISFFRGCNLVPPNPPPFIKSLTI